MHPSLLDRHLDNYRSTRVLPNDGRAADIFDQLHLNYPRTRAMDLRIAAIALRFDALLITRNVNDFSKIFNLRVADWTK
jgi:tRNA(fMet)-specific endonuclease VapC